MLLNDLTKVDASAFKSPDYAVRQEEAGRMTIVCSSCSGFAAIDVLLGRGPGDGTEERIRSGKTTAKTMFEACKKNAEARGTVCFAMAPANKKGAVGFVSEWKINDTTFGATYTLYQDGKLLTMRNVAGSRRQAKRLGRLAFRHIAPQVVR